MIILGLSIQTRYNGYCQSNQYIFLAIGLVLITCAVSIIAGANNLHTYDGISNGEIIGSDIFFEIIDPEELSYTYRVIPAQNFGVPFNDTIYMQRVRLVPVDPPDGCGWPKNAEKLRGNVVLVERGECSFTSKAVRAEEAGARAVIVTDCNRDFQSFYVEMTEDQTLRDVNIPVGYLLGKNGDMIRKTLKQMQKNYAIINIPVNLTYVETRKINQPPWINW